MGEWSVERGVLFFYFFFLCVCKNWWCDVFC